MSARIHRLMVFVITIIVAFYTGGCATLKVSDLENSLTPSNSILAITSDDSGYAIRDALVILTHKNTKISSLDSSEKGIVSVDIDTLERYEGKYISVAVLKKGYDFYETELLYRIDNDPIAIQLKSLNMDKGNDLESTGIQYLHGTVRSGDVNIFRARVTARDSIGDIGATISAIDGTFSIPFDRSPVDDRLAITVQATGYDDAVLTVPYKPDNPYFEVSLSEKSALARSVSNNRYLYMILLAVTGALILQTLELDKQRDRNESTLLIE